MTGGLRRRELLGAMGFWGGIGPLVRSALADEATPRPPRLVLLMQSNGTSQANFWPAADSFTSPILKPLLDDPALRAKTTIIKGLFNHAGGAGNGHDQGFAGLYSGYRSVGTFGDPWGAGVSLDQQLKNQLHPREPYPTLNCGVLASDTPPFKAHRTSFSYVAPQQQVPALVDLYRLYSTFFPAGPSSSGDGATQAMQRLRKRQTVLDYVNVDLGQLRQRVGTRDRERLDQHTTALREFEARLALTLDPTRQRPPRCLIGQPPAAGLTFSDEAEVPVLMPLMLDFVALAITCNLTRLVTFQFGNSGEKWRFKWLGINENSHDDLAHRDFGQDPVVTGKVVKINVWYAEQVAQLARRLDAVAQGAGTVLDQSLVVWGNELATGPHGLDDIPLVILGGGAGRLARTGYLVDEGPQPYHRLGTSLLNLMGIAAAGFGEEPGCGPVRGLAVA